MMPSAACPTLAQSLTLDRFGAFRNGRALSDPLSIRLLPGTVLGVVGPNGVGKSSLLGAIAHAGVQSYGTVFYGDENLSRMRPRSRAQALSLLAQDLRAPDELQVRELVMIGAHASARNDVASAVESALESAGIASLADRRFGSISGGQKQLVQLARVLAQDTPVVIFDEPTSALDPELRKEVEKLILENRATGITQIVVTHDMQFAENIADEIIKIEPKH